MKITMVIEVRTDSEAWAEAPDEELEHYLATAAHFASEAALNTDPVVEPKLSGNLTDRRGHPAGAWLAEVTK